ncbi:MAG TPA: hypothetical protein ENJ15_07920 [Caldithrix abyssi]|uniref:PorV/PorQ family protein n=1 Tax=Caldithrix abyssi TaxID=187145 RepID=A0A7V5VFE1_CALAY|nr:hypothetical protein [Caldithrix abyssi]
MKTKTLILIILMFAATLWADVSKTGTTAGKFLNIGMGPRTVAMGGAYSFSTDDPGAVYWNPAGIGRISRPMGLFSQTSWIADVNLNFITMAMPTGDAGVFSASVTAVTMPDMLETTEFQPEGMER